MADGIEFDLWKLGMVCATGKPEDARKVLRSLEGMRKHGYELPDDILDEDGIHALEPSLNERVKAGFHLEGQWHVRADTLVNGLAVKLREMGVEFVEGAEVIEFHYADSAVHAVRTGARRHLRRPLPASRGLVDDTAGAQAGAVNPDGAGQGLLVPAHPEGDAEARDSLRGHPRRG